ncbi:hypothetical protein G3578_04870 [Brevibacillus sp. SYP-B805]|uniref:zinc ribbon domain-containing protein n=1 Tax=Brevibacillus sp. SYP-B805 TaxID=1578199 RepID=UPI0013EAC738|nr:zinc ribbon domain-containing protein [Brevibacillus sp. SYP-B805]NGQ94511.1 hypothetical protein [Brevibacillus sp. SYP-B805]
MSKNFGLFILIAGFVCLGFSMFEFLTLDMWETPKYFWLAFVALPLLFFGFVLSAPRIQRSLLNQQRDNIRETMKVMADGLREGLHATNKICEKCNHRNEASAIYCSHCGTAL